MQRALVAVALGSPVALPAALGVRVGVLERQRLARRAGVGIRFRLVGERLRELRTEQAEARRRYWQQVGPVAQAVVQVRRALFSPLEEALLLGYFSRLECVESQRIQSSAASRWATARKEEAVFS